MKFFELGDIQQNQCFECKLHLNCNSPKIGVTGKGKLKILLITEAPGTKEDKTGKHLIGEAGKYLNSECNDIGFDIYEDCWIIGAVNCKLPNNRKPTKKEISYCSYFWKQAVKELQPKKIILLGPIAIETFLSNRMSKIGGINKWIGFKIPDQKYKCWVYPMFHPAYVKNQKNIIIENRFYDNLSAAFHHNEEFQVDKVNVKTIENLRDAIFLLEEIIDTSPKLLSFDYEGTGLKPHRKEHKIKTVAFSWDGVNGYATEIYNDWRFTDLLEIVLTNRNIKKTAHNIKFEETWTRQKLGYQINKWEWDSMLAAHVIDNRGGISGLKFQIYINFGVLGYEDKINKFLTSRKTNEENYGANGINRIDEANINDILYYNALDAIYGYKLAIKQQKIINQNKNLKRAYKLFHRGIESYMDIEELGWNIDSEYYNRMYHFLRRKNKKSVKLILNSNENKKWVKKYKTNINYKSIDQLRKLFFEIYDYKVKKRTEKNRISVDADTLKYLSEQGSEIANELLNIRKNKGLLDKIKGFQREAVNNIIHPSYNLHIARSYRSSCSDPNMQNASKRDLEAKKILRQGVIAKPGCQIISRDYSGVEVSTACFYHKDPVMIKYVTDPKSDMHRDQAARIFLLEKSQITKFIRYIAKNGFVFPQFYGDWYQNCAENMWQMLQNEKLEDGTKLIDYLVYEQKIKSLNEFKEHVKEEEYYFWYKKFSVYRKWKEKHWEEYQKNGYIEFLTGFRCTDILTKNEAINRPIQGTAFHLLLWSQIQIHKKLKSEGWKTKIIGQIHDDLLFSSVPEEFEDFQKMADEIETQKIRKHWPWINVPLRVESEISEINGNWYAMTEVK